MTSQSLQDSKKQTRIKRNIIELFFPYHWTFLAEIYKGQLLAILEKKEKPSRPKTLDLK